MIIRHCWPSDEAHQLQLTPFIAFQTAICCSTEDCCRVQTALLNPCYFSVLRESERIKHVWEGLSMAHLKVSDKITTTSVYFILFVPSGRRDGEPLCQ